jgi:8-oxo-dGTP diphosphatase
VMAPGLIGSAGLRPATGKTDAMAEVLCAGAIILDDAGRLLLIRRGRPPGVGLWSVPGGKCESGEDAEAACVREAREETGLEVAVLRHAGRVERPGLGGDVFVIDDFVCAVRGGAVSAGDDAADARWFTIPDAVALERAGGVVDGLLEALRGWALIPRPPD